MVKIEKAGFCISFQSIREQNKCVSCSAVEETIGENDNAFYFYSQLLAMIAQIFFKRTESIRDSHSPFFCRWIIENELLASKSSIE